MKPERRVYFAKPIGMDGPIKIGCSELPETRLASLTVWSPWPLEIIGSVPGEFADEQFLHDCFLDCHSHREWFRSTPLLRETIAKILSAGSVAVVRPLLAPKGSLRQGHRRPRTDEERKRYSYSCRIMWAQKRLRAKDEYGAWDAPDDVDAIIDRWGRNNRTPSAAEFARLDAYLADPATHSVIPSWRRTKVAA